MSSIEKKHDIAIEASADISSGDVFHIDPEEERRVVRKLDWNLLPLCMAAFVLNYLDRSNIGNAKIAGMVKDLGMKGHEFNSQFNLAHASHVHESQYNN